MGVGEEKKKVKIYIDGKEIEVEEGKNIIEAGRSAGIHIPHFCYHPLLSIAGSCRMCLVEIEGQAKLQPACNTYVRDGLKVKTNTETVKWARRMVLEYYLIHHPLDCPICDKAGECRLQDYTFLYGPRDSRFKYEKKGKVMKSLGKKINMDMDRCVMCTRCVRFLREVVKEEELIVSGRGDECEITTPPGRELINNYACFTSDICPVGALTIKKFRFNYRVFMHPNKITTCPFCSSLCRIKVGVWRREIVRVISGDPEREIICDEGRFKCFDLLRSRYKNYPVEIQGSRERRVFLHELKNIFSTFTKNDALCVSCWIPDEWAEYLKDWARKNSVRGFKLKPLTGKSDNLKMSQIKAPNENGVNRILDDWEDYVGLESAIEKGEIERLFIIHPGPFDYLPPVKSIPPFLIYGGIDLPEIRGEKFYYVPLTSLFEMSGSFTSSSGKVYFEKVLEPQRDIYEVHQFMEREEKVALR